MKKMSIAMFDCWKFVPSISHYGCVVPMYLISLFFLVELCEIQIMKKHISRSKYASPSCPTNSSKSTKFYDMLPKHNNHRTPFPMILRIAYDYIIHTNFTIATTTASNHQQVLENLRPFPTIDRPQVPKLRIL